MSGKPQSLSEGQRSEVARIVRNQVLTWVLIGLAILTGITGVGLWQIYAHVKAKMETLVVKQFEEPTVRKTLQEVATAKASDLMVRQIQPEVDRFKTEIAKRLEDLQLLVSRTKTLEQQGQEHEKTIRTVLASVQNVLRETQATRDRIVGLQSDIVTMQKCAARIQYYALKGRNTFPNPYQKEMVAALNEMLSIALPDPAKRTQFINEMGGPNL